jgi:hypothetical protein
MTISGSVRKPALQSEADTGEGQGLPLRSGSGYFAFDAL